MHHRRRRNKKARSAQRHARQRKRKRKKGGKKRSREKNAVSHSATEKVRTDCTLRASLALFSPSFFFSSSGFVFAQKTIAPKTITHLNKGSPRKKTGVKLISAPFFFFLCCCCRRFSFLIPSQLECLIALQQHRRHGRPEHQETARDIAPIRGHPALHPSDAIGSAHAAAQHSARAACTAHRGLDVDSALQDEPDADAVDVLALPADAWHCALGVAAPHQVVQPCCCQFVVAAFVF